MIEDDDSIKCTTGKQKCGKYACRWRWRWRQSSDDSQFLIVLQNDESIESYDFCINDREYNDDNIKRMTDKKKKDGENTLVDEDEDEENLITILNF